MRARIRFSCIWIAVFAIAGLGAIGWFVYRACFSFAVPEAAELRHFVRNRPPVPVVFTSRTEPASFTAAAPEANGFHYPGTIPWAAREGRLRLLDADGKVYELTWGRPLPGGGTLIDVMSPSVSLDGRRILFAGRKAAPDPGRWRIYQINSDGSNLMQLTGGPDDPGCIAAPPLRFAADGTALPDADRRRIDYDDVDPTDRGNGEILFASSRIPDLGRDHGRRATQIWRRDAAGELHPLSANRNNDRWPVLTFNEWIMWSQWSRNREVVTADGTDIRPASEAMEPATRPTDNWMAARLFPDGMHFGYLVKIPEPVWRPRPLFNGRIAFMTPDPETGAMRLAQAPVGLLRIAPSSQAGGGPLPKMTGAGLVTGPVADDSGERLSAGCPSPCPPGDILFAARPLSEPPAAYGLYRVADDWSRQPPPEMLFDDPNLVDAEPVAVYPRDITLHEHQFADSTVAASEQPRLLSGRVYGGPFGQLESHFLNIGLEYPVPNVDTDTGAGPVITHPSGVKSVVFYGAHRDRFDDPVEPRLKGEWEKLFVVPLNEAGELRVPVPADPLMPTVLAGLGEDGTVFRWSSGASDSSGRSASFYAYAGDHYSGMRPGGYVFCNGCHTGHTFLDIDLAERIK
jgi:hypothetical protein